MKFVRWEQDRRAAFGRIVVVRTPRRTPFLSARNRAAFSPRIANPAESAISFLCQRPIRPSPPGLASAMSTSRSPTCSAPLISTWACSASSLSRNTARRRRSFPPRGTTGLFHTAILYPTRADLGDALRRLIAAKVPLDGASDHGVSEALYLRDPDQNGVELYWDRPQADWPRTPSGELAMVTEPLDLQSLLAAK